MPPTLPLPTALRLLRWTTALLFMAHAVARIAKGTIPQFATFLGQVGFPFPVLVVWLVTITELASGMALLAGRGVRWGAAALFTIAATGILLIHARLGWWVGEHGTGGSEYSVALLAMLLVVAADEVPRG